MMHWFVTEINLVLFILLSVGGTAATHVWLRRSRFHRGVPGYAWLVQLGMVVAGYFLSVQAESFQEQQMQRLVSGFAPTYAAELERMGHARVGPDTRPQDPVYLSLIEAQIRWLQLNPAVADIYTFRKTAEGRLVLMVDSETDYDRNGRYEGHRESRTAIGEVYEQDLGPAFEWAWSGRPTFDDRIVQNRWGTRISAFVPMFDDRGRVEAVLGVEYPAQEWIRNIAVAQISVLVVIFILEMIWVGTTTSISVLRAEVEHRRVVEAKLAAHQADLERLVTERTEDLLKAQRQILHNEKLACVGQLAAGVAHEINTPIQYIGDNLRAVAANLDELLAVEGKYRELLDLVREGSPTDPAVREIEAAEQAHDLDYLVEDTPKAISQSLEGVDRVTRIVRAMKDFSHVHDEGFAPANLNDILQSTLTIARNEYKYVADVETELGQLSAVECCASEMGQVFLNLILNAGHAIADTQQRGTITVRTQPVGREVEITVADTGTGIPPEIRDRIFDPFFTTKGVGKGTGQGLGIIQQIVWKHRGTVTFETQVGQGTVFTVRLPIQQHEPAQTADGAGT
ncbi:MAG: hypothetical protein HY718_21510 [Planctomycetes bacterium]|nr:hypothetical protein [Planctomycetota bacterium]